MLTTGTDDDLLFLEAFRGEIRLKGRAFKCCNLQRVKMPGGKYVEVHQDMILRKNASTI